MDTPRKSYWFKRKRYGYGWVPSTWQGWLAILLYLIALFAGTLIVRDVPEDTLTREVVVYCIYVAFITTILLIVSFVKGPPAKWRWGARDDDDPRLDY